MRADELGRELEDERDFLLRSLDDLEAEHAAGDLEDADYTSLKQDYTARAARVLRRLEQVDDPLAAPRGEPAAASARPSGRSPGADARRSRSRWPLLLGIAFTVALAGGSGYLVTRSSGERRPDQGVSGGPDSSPATLLAEAVQLDNGGKLVEAAKLYDAVLAREPDNVVALSRRGWVLGRSGRQAGNPDLLRAGLGYLDRATGADPGYADAHAFRGLVLGALARPGEAGCEFRLWLAITPADDEQRPAIEGVLDEATTQAGGTLPPCPEPPRPVPVPAGAPSPGPTGGSVQPGMAGMAGMSGAP
ncbi:MAG: hypothetical protein ABIS47_00035 [Acidimicrobiales bacterium]